MKIEIISVSSLVLEELRLGNGVAFGTENREPGQVAFMCLEDDKTKGLPCQIKKDGRYYMIFDEMVALVDFVDFVKTKEESKNDQ